LQKDALRVNIEEPQKEEEKLHFWQRGGGKYGFVPALLCTIPAAGLLFLCFLKKWA
jgi:hypothetical protein